MGQVHWVFEGLLSPADVEVTHEQEGDRNIPRRSVISFKPKSRETCWPCCSLKGEEDADCAYQGYFTREHGVGSSGMG